MHFVFNGENKDGWKGDGSMEVKRHVLRHVLKALEGLWLSLFFWIVRIQRAFDLNEGE